VREREGEREREEVRVRERESERKSVCVYVCVRVRACVRACVRVCECVEDEEQSGKQRRGEGNESRVLWASKGARGFAFLVWV
jgi:hypothetical protein